MDLFSLMATKTTGLEFVFLFPNAESTVLFLFFGIDERIDQCLEDEFYLIFLFLG